MVNIKSESTTCKMARFVIDWKIGNFTRTCSKRLKNCNKVRKKMIKGENWQVKLATGKTHCKGYYECVK